MILFYFSTSVHWTGWHYGSNVVADFELWLKDLNDYRYLAISRVASAGDMKVTVCARTWPLIVSPLNGISCGLLPTTGLDSENF